MKHSKKHLKAYTLIELLFVIAILAVIAAVAVSVLHRKAQTARINRAALEIQQVLEAAMTYSVQNNDQWPPDNNNTPNCDTETTTINNFVNNYLPNENRISIFGRHYCWAKVPSVAPSAKGAYRFWVAIDVTNQALAERIAARLPNAITTTDPTANTTQAPACAVTGDCYVRTEIALPQAGGSGSGNYVAAGYCQPGSTVTVGHDGCAENTAAENSQPYIFSYDVYAHCPDTNEQAYVVGSPNFYNTNQGNFLTSMFSCKTQGNSSLPVCCNNADSCSVAASSNDQMPTLCQSVGGAFVCHLHFQAIINNFGSFDFLYRHSGNYNGTIGASYIVFCRDTGSSVGANNVRY